MAKKDMDALLGNILGSAIIRPQDKCEETKQEAVQSEKPVNNNTPESPEAPWKHFSFICVIVICPLLEIFATSIIIILSLIAWFPHICPEVG